MLEKVSLWLDQLRTKRGVVGRTGEWTDELDVVRLISNQTPQNPTTRDGVRVCHAASGRTTASPVR